MRLPAHRREFHKEADRFETALRLRDEGKYEEAVQLLLPISERHPKVAATFGVLGGIFYELELYAQAADNFRRAVEINPRSELATRGLYHCLRELGEDQEAIQLLHDFAEETDSDAFAALLQAHSKE